MAGAGRPKPERLTRREQAKQAALRAQHDGAGPASTEQDGAGPAQAAAEEEGPAEEVGGGMLMQWCVCARARACVCMRTRMRIHGVNGKMVSDGRVVGDDALRKGCRGCQWILHAIVFYPAAFGPTCTCPRLSLLSRTMCRMVLRGFWEGLTK